MRKLLVSLTLCLQLTSNGLAHQQPNLPPPPKPPEQKPAPSPTPPPQQPDDIDVVKITTNLVQIDAVVTDRREVHVTDLRADEVEILENGKPQKITDFSYIRMSRPPAAANKPNENAGPSIPVPP
ncbi:MAG TPA: hypothetical protein VFY61_18595, partial [Pyrinomonadaceae bacterium]|nr:hypothetical protein [Pyrinomonadaceae bacterium]